MEIHCLYQRQLIACRRMFIIYFNYGKAIISEAIVGPSRIGRFSKRPYNSYRNRCGASRAGWRRPQLCDSFVSLTSITEFRPAPASASFRDTGTPACVILPAQSGAGSEEVFGAETNSFSAFQFCPEWNWLRCDTRSGTGKKAALTCKCSATW